MSGVAGAAFKTPVVLAVAVLASMLLAAPEALRAQAAFTAADPGPRPPPGPFARMPSGVPDSMMRWASGARLNGSTVSIRARSLPAAAAATVSATFASVLPVPPMMCRLR